MPPTISDEDRKRLVAELSGWRGATLQKLWLPSPQLCVLQLRLPGRTTFAVVDARLRMAALAESRPTSPKSAPRSQGTLRNALEGSRFTGASLILPGDRRAVSARLEFDDRALIAEEALLLVDTGSGRIVWASSGAQRRPGSSYPLAEEIAIADTAPLPAREALVTGAVEGEERAGLIARRKELVARLRSRVQKLNRTLAAVDQDAARAAEAGAGRARAEMLLPVASRIPRGARDARVQDWTRLDAEGRPVEVVIPLDPALSAAENAQRWLRRARRYQAAAARIAHRRAEVVGEIERAQALLSRAQSAADAAELAAVESEVPEARQTGRKRGQAPRLPYRTFTSQSGASILVGRSARDNDALSFRVARGNDLWLHARAVQGAHVVLPGAGDAPDGRTLGDAALLAAHFSSARGEDRVEVAWTRCKYLRKRKGAAPGSVIVTQEKVLRVRLEADRLAALLRTET